MQEGVDAKSEQDKVPTEEVKSSPVLILNSDNFEDEIKTGVTFVKFFAPWCGHCKRLAPTWDELATKMEEKEGVKVAKVDCTSNENKNKVLCNEQGVSLSVTSVIFLK
jgi:thioredoxin domain-containing protein 5